MPRAMLTLACSSLLGPHMPVVWGIEDWVRLDPWLRAPEAGCPKMEEVVLVPHVPPAPPQQWFPSRPLHREVEAQRRSLVGPHPVDIPVPDPGLLQPVSV